MTFFFFFYHCLKGFHKAQYWVLSYTQSILKVPYSTVFHQFMCWSSLQTISQFLNHVDRPSKTGFMIYHVLHAFLLMLPSRLLQEEMVKMGFFLVLIGGKMHHTSQSQT